MSVKICLWTLRDVMGEAASPFGEVIGIPFFLRVVWGEAPLCVVTDGPGCSLNEKLVPNGFIGFAGLVEGGDCCLASGASATARDEAVVELQEERALLPLKQSSNEEPTNSGTTI